MIDFRYCTVGMLLFSSVLLPGCLQPGLEKQETINKVLLEVKKEYAPDGRVAIVETKAQIEGDLVVLSGETDQAVVPDIITGRLREIGFEVKNEVNLLPDQSLGGDFFGVINNSVSNIRSQPRHSGELATQALLGMEVKVLKKQGSWYLVQTPDKYISWVDHGGLVTMNQASYEVWKQADKIIYLEANGYVYSNPDFKKDIVADIVMGCQLKLVSELGEYFEVQYPDGRNGFVEKSKSERYETWLTQINDEKAILMERALSLKGTPYLWGGTSSKGMDCSGFTKTVYLMSGLVIPRDASQQVNEGLKIDSELTFDGLEIGDLLFFGTPATDSTKQRTTHVGMWIGDDQFIHASKNVRISSVNKNSSNYDGPNVNRYLGSQRYLNQLTSGIKDLKGKQKKAM